MKIILSFIVFCIVLFFYLHIHYHLKTSNDLEVYTIDNPSKNKLEEICNIRQPVVFKFDNSELLEICNLSNFESNYGAFDIKIRDRTKINDDVVYLPFVLREAIDVFSNDSEGKLISENNQDFLEETSVIKKYKYNDSFLRPPMVSKCTYDFMTGSNNSKTILKYNLNYRNFYYVTGGKVKIKLIAPHYGKYLYENKDYEHFEFSTEIDPWDVQDSYKNNFDKIKVLDVELSEGDIIYIPAYWWFSIKYEEISSICVFKYRTYMNTFSILPELFVGFLQNQNIKRETVDKL
jgi:hypothetical protein|tara:strand:- start:865 stop:1737 length:873 start_codon:yes stop_codon:yes gene_type:complete